MFKELQQLSIFVLTQLIKKTMKQNTRSFFLVSCSYVVALPGTSNGQLARLALELISGHNIFPGSESRVEIGIEAKAADSAQLIATNCPSKEHCNKWRNFEVRVSNAHL